MTTFPTYEEIGWAAPDNVQLQFKTLTSSFDDQGKEKRRRKWLYPKRLISVQYNYLTQDEINTLWQFYIDRKGAYDAFSFYFKNRDNYTKEYVGTGDNTTFIFSLPSKEASAYNFYSNDNLLEETTDYTFFSSLGASGGVDGSDKVQFVSAPEDNNRITYSFNGVLRVVCRFEQDNQDFQSFHRILGSTGITLQGLLIDEELT